MISKQSKLKSLTSFVSPWLHVVLKKARFAKKGLFFKCNKAPMFIKVNHLLGGENPSEPELLEVR